MATSRATPARAAVDLTFEELYRGHRADVYRAALRALGNAHDAEDVTQAAFVDAYRAVLRGTRPQSPRAWLLAISDNVRRRRYRTLQRRPREQPLDADFPLTAELPIDQAHALDEALASLPPAQRHVFVLREIVGLSYDEIAEEVDSTVASVQMLLFRARRSLRAELDPPTVATRRPSFLPPVPAWLATTLSRFDIAGMTPRAAGALGATVLTIAGASVAVPAPHAAADRTPTAVERSVPAAGRPAVTHAAPTRAPRVAKAPTSSFAAFVTTTKRPARRGHPVATALPPALGPVAAEPHPAAPTPAAVPITATPHTAPVLERAPVAGTVVDAAVTAVSALPQPSASLPLPLPLPLPASPPPVPDLVEAATGAAGAAGASAPPLPVPAVPLPTLPPLP